MTFWLAVGWALCIGGAIAWALWFFRLSTSRRERSRAGGRTVGVNSTRKAEPPVDAAVAAARQPVARKQADDSTLEQRPPRPRVPTGDSVDKLKEKAAVKAPSKTAREHEVAVLKAKLGGDARSNGRKHATGEPAANPRAAQICRIVWTPDDGESRFAAKTHRADGATAVVSSSPPFHWGEPTPPPTSLPRAAKAHAVLVHELKAAGWTTIGRGQEWYSLELERRSSVAAREGEA